jgi:hypothetical protein
MIMSCFGAQQARSLNLRLQEAEAHLEAKRLRHAEAEAKWKKEQQNFIAEVESQRKRIDEANANIVFLERGPEHSARVKILEAQIDLFLNKNNPEFVERVFSKHADKVLNLIMPNKLCKALSEFGLYLQPDDAAALMTMMDIDNNGGLDLKEFAAALRQPSTPEEQFVQTLPISGMLASCLTTPKATDPLKELCNLSSEQLKAAIDAFSFSLYREVKKQLFYLKSLVDVKESKALEDADGSGTKSAVLVMNAGSVKEFYEGMYERIGGHFHNLHIAMIKFASCYPRISYIQFSSPFLKNKLIAISNGRWYRISQHKIF